MKVLPLTARKNSHLWLRISLWTFHIRSRYVMTTSEPSPHGGDCALLRRPKADWIFASEREREREIFVFLSKEYGLRVGAHGVLTSCWNHRSVCFLSFGFEDIVWKCGSARRSPNAIEI